MELKNVYVSKIETGEKFSVYEMNCTTLAKTASKQEEAKNTMMEFIKCYSGIVKSPEWMINACGYCKVEFDNSVKLDTQSGVFNVMENGKGYSYAICLYSGSKEACSQFEDEQRKKYRETYGDDFSITIDCWTEPSEETEKYI